MTPEQATSWWAVVDQGGLTIVLFLIVAGLAFGIWRLFCLAPAFLAKWQGWTDAVEKLNERMDKYGTDLENVARWCKEHNGNHQ